MKNYYLKIKIVIALFALIALGIFLRLVFLGKLVLPQVYFIGPIKIHYYGLIMAVAVIAGFYLAWKRREQYQLSEKSAEDIMFWAIIGGFLGGRLYHVVSSFNFYMRHPIEIVAVWNGGLSIYGAVFGGLIALLVLRYLSPRPLALSSLLDWLTPSLVLGQIIGRFGNLFNYEAFGYPTNLPWKMFVPLQFRPALYQGFNFFHPFFLYEILGNCLILFFLIKISKKPGPGQLFFCYLLLYNILRFGLEFIRVDSTFLGPVRLNAVVSLILVVISVYAICRNYCRKPA